LVGESAPGVSIVLPTRNGAATLPPLLDALAGQRLDLPFEIIAVDSSSTDGTAQLLKNRVDRLISIPASAFDHGLTRNAGIEQARGDLIVLLVQDATPASDRWLAALVAPLRADPTIAGAFARQCPRPEASAISRHYLARWVAAADVGRVVAVQGSDAFAVMSPLDRFLSCAFDNVCSCVRRSIWEEHPFRSCNIGEDLEWARDVLLAGHRLAFVPQSVVMHSHDRSSQYEFVRTYLLHRRLFELFDLQTIPNVRVLAKSIAGSLALHLRCQRANPAGTGRAVALAFAWPLAQYLGARSAIKGRKPIRSRAV